MGGAFQDLAVIQPKGLPEGTLEYEEKRATILKAFASKVPRELRLPANLISEPPNDVSTVPATCGLLSLAELRITEDYDATDLAREIAHKQLTAVEVATAFSKRAIIAHQVTCCLTQWFMDEAISQAKALDEYLERTGRTIGPLHGVPISIKEHMPIAGTYSSPGYIAGTVLDKKDCHMVALLRSMGAVFYCKTNQPQAVMHLESTSHYGRTLNPFNINLSSGGSSGGESALVGMRGSVMGVGSDIGGSIRCPSAFCGIYGFKPTSCVLPMRDMLSHPFSAELNILACAGPMCRSLRDMNLFTQVIIDSKPWLEDPKLIPIPWTGLNTRIESKPLRIGIVEHDGFIVPQPPVRRAIAWAKERLSNPANAESFDIKSFNPLRVKEAMSYIRRTYFPDGGAAVKEALSSGGEPILPLTEWALLDAETDGMLNAEEVNQLRGQRDRIRADFVQSWGEQNIDVVIAPAFVGPACAHDTAFYWSYTGLWNLVDYPAVVFPTPIKTEKGEKYGEDYKPLGKECAHVQKLWEQTSFEGAPINLQIIARRYHDNDLFGALNLLKDVFELP